MSEEFVADNFADFFLQFEDALRFHVLLMMIGWAAIVPAAIILSVLYKKNPKNYKWRCSHVLLMFVAIVLLTFGNFFGAQFVNNEGNDHAVTLHAVLGWITFLMINLLFITGCYNCADPDEDKKVERTFCLSMWEQTHRWGGRITVALAVFAAIEGINEADLQVGPADGLDDVNNAFIAVSAGMTVILAVYALFCRKTKKKEDKVTPTEPGASPSPMPSFMTGGGFGSGGYGGGMMAAPRQAFNRASALFGGARQPRQAFNRVSARMQGMMGFRQQQQQQQQQQFQQQQQQMRQQQYEQQRMMQQGGGSVVSGYSGYSKPGPGSQMSASGYSGYGYTPGPSSQVSGYNQPGPGSQVSGYNQPGPGSQVNGYNRPGPGSQGSGYNRPGPGSQVSGYNARGPGTWPQPATRAQQGAGGGELTPQQQQYIIDLQNRQRQWETIHSGPTEPRF